MTLPFDDRVVLAYDSLVLTFERRGGFMSDSDVLEAAENYTTSVFPDGRIATDEEAADYRLLCSTLFNMLTPTN